MTRNLRYLRSEPQIPKQMTITHHPARRRETARTLRYLRSEPAFLLKIDGLTVLE
jgi:hypothetical protein